MVCVVCTLALVGTGIGLSGCIKTTPKDPIKETKNITIETTMNAPTDIEFAKDGNGNVKIVWNYQETENVQAGESIKFTVSHEDGVSVVEGTEITVSETAIDDVAVKIKTNAASSYAGADKVEEDKENNKIITTKTTYSFKDSAAVSKAYEKEEKQEIKLTAPTNFGISESGVLNFAVDVNAKTFDIWVTVDGKKMLYENVAIADASKDASFEIANYDKTKAYNFEVELNGYEQTTIKYIDSAKGTFAKQAETIQDISFKDFTDKLIPKIEKDIWNASKILEVYSVERKGKELKIFLKSYDANGKVFKEYKATYPETIETKSLSELASEWDKNSSISFTQTTNYNTTNPALSQTYKQNANLSSEIKNILNNGTILMESTTPSNLSDFITSTVLVKKDGKVYKTTISSTATINHGDINKYMNEAVAGKNRTRFKETTEELSNAITAESTPEKTATSALKTFKTAPVAIKQISYNFPTMNE